jgi:3-isopropylmalate/(R)-2-methylmalate dehydratase small subunit
MKLQSFNIHKGVVLPLDISNVDTDMIIPKQFLKSVKRTGFGPYLFDEMRYKDKAEYGDDCATREINPSFILNENRFKTASILLTRENFGCGSSREHAPWAILEYGFRVILASSFADIFFSNSVKNGLLPVMLSKEKIEMLFEITKKKTVIELTVNLPNQLIFSDALNIKVPFEISSQTKNYLSQGLDEIASTLKNADAIRKFQENRFRDKPWLNKNPSEVIK